ncbi:11239_t:CDS:2 [Gigaspora margarita]|uniref:11239_t:CDS:1 n=1 Tax=Gigaspora margarita TaxID=4874 RepID=A0ABM8W0A3_GIGMA|nr:11239_t:CDS:2 [Gigaspora margarita]
MNAAKEKLVILTVLDQELHFVIFTGIKFQWLVTNGRSNSQTFTAYVAYRSRNTKKLLKNKINRKRDSLSPGASLRIFAKLRDRSTNDNLQNMILVETILSYIVQMSFKSIAVF